VADPLRRSLQDKLFPCLLNRLTDDYPKAKRERREHRIQTLRQYREAFLTDIAFLLNSALPMPPKAMAAAGLAQTECSVLCYGVESSSGTWISSDRLELVSADVRRALVRFEPRLNPRTLDVRVLDQSSPDTETGSMVSVDIRGELWAEPLTEQMLVRASVDLDTGHWRVRSMR
jgi:type VI secretion system protein ImpF